MSTGLERALAEVVGREHVLTDRSVVSSYETDWTGRFAGRARLVVRPADTGQVAECVQLCAADGASIVPQGGNTGLVGGSVPCGGEVVLSTRRLSDLEEVDVAAGQVSAGAGVVLGTLHRHVRTAGLAFGVDLASRDSATVGGMVSTNAGGVRVVRHGRMRRQLLGVEAVLATGGVVSRMSRPAKDNAGYDLVSLLCGSEGTLGVVTRARLRLVAPQPQSAVAIVGVPDVAAAVGLLAALRRSGLTLEAVELMFGDGLGLVARHLGRSAPLRPVPPVAVLAEVSDDSQTAGPRLAETIDALGETGVVDAVVADDPAGRAALWSYREAHTEAINGVGTPVKLDVAVPVHALPELVERVRAIAAGRCSAYLFGHLAEGNVHVNLVGAPEPRAVGDQVLEQVVGLGGSISAEHGIGRAKAGLLSRVRGEADVAAMRSIKRALDPDGVLNPGVLFTG